MISDRFVTILHGAGFGYRAIGRTFTAIVIISPLAAPSLIFLTDNSAASDPTISLAVMWIIIANLLAIQIAIKAFQRDNRKRLPKPDEAFENDTRPPVLFLRSFSKDSVVAFRELKMESLLPWSQNFHDRPISFEESLSGEVNRHIGPFIGLGNPNDILPTFGAAKSYSSENSWKSIVAGYCQKAQLILIQEGTTEGLFWELQHIRQYVSPSKVFIITAPDPFERRKNEWNSFSSALERAGYSTIESDPGRGSILSLNSMWQMVITASNLRTPSQIVATLYSSFEEANRVPKAD